MIALALKERKVRLQTGYGLEGVLPDSWAGSISREVAHKSGKGIERVDIDSFDQGCFGGGC